MPVNASAEKRELILKIYKYFGAESKRKAPFYAWNKVIDRTVQALGISCSFLNKILKKEPVELNEKSVNKCKDSLDSFDKDLMRRVVVGFFSKNEYVSPCIKWSFSFTFGPKNICKFSKLIPFFQQKLSQAFSLLVYNIHKLYIT
jgi:hypothetical protein